MKTRATTDPVTRIESQAILAAYLEDSQEFPSGQQDLDSLLQGRISRMQKTGEFKAKYKEHALLHTDSLPSGRLLIFGLGKREDLTTDRIRSILAIAARYCRRIQVRSLAVPDFSTLGLHAEDVSRALAEGVLLGQYKFTKYLGKSAEKYKNNMEELIVYVQDPQRVAAVQSALEEGTILGEATNFTRDLVNEPANCLTPSVFADIASKTASEVGIECGIYEKEEMEQMGMGALLAVAKGSVEAPKLVVLKYEGSPGGKWIGFVGKGITFDSGGLSLKSDEHMRRMNTDMAGAAAVLGAMKAIAQKNLPCNCLAVMPMCENLPDGRASKVGDIVVSMEGKTIEILSTDAEGRMLLADALTFSRRQGVDYLVDIATLTGGIVVALGHQMSGCMGNDQKMVNAVLSAGEKADERLWQLPLLKEYRMQLESDVADIENDGGRPASAITAAIFLKEFAGNIPWAHIDIAGTAIVDEEIMIYLRNPYLPKEGGTGVGVRTLYHLAKDLSQENS